MAVLDAESKAAASLFLASICQAKEGIERLELLFTQNLRPAVEADLKRAHESAEEQWLAEKQDLLRQLEFERQEKLALKEELQMARDRCEAEAQEKGRLQAKLKKKDLELDAKSFLLTGLNTRYVSMKRQYNAMSKPNEVVKLNDQQEPPLKKLCQETSDDNKVCKGDADCEAPAKIKPPAAEVPDVSPRVLKVAQQLAENNRTPVEKFTAQAVPASAEPKKKGTLKDFMTRSTWRTTRAETSRADKSWDPHDDFLNTPRELALKQRKEAVVEEPDEGSDSEIVPDSQSQEEPVADKPQDPPHPTAMKPTSTINKQREGPQYKYIEPVRKKADREALDGFECQQCKKFYDAVLARDAHGVTNTRCQRHHEAVSRHRFKYAPPATPEGFWNIGFD